MEGIRSIFDSAWKMCVDTDEVSKYLMTFQNLLSQVPKWNSIIVEKERQRIIERSDCHYLEDLITCVHIIQLKVITAMRVGNRQKKIDISIPKLDHFIHKIYIHVARKVYMNVYLFEKNISPLQMQKNGRELEQIIQECILTTIRESIPTESIIRAFLEEAIEHEEEITIEPIPEDTIEGGEGKNVNTEKPVTSLETNNKQDTIQSTNSAIETFTTTPLLPELSIPTLGVTPLTTQEEPITTKLTFNDIDSVLDSLDQVSSVEAPKTIERLEEISTSNAMQRKLLEQQQQMQEDDTIPIQDKLRMGEEIPLDVDPMMESLGGEDGKGGGIYLEESPITLDIEEFV